MKKTLIAAAVASVASVAAAPVAMADVSVSGIVEQTFTWTDSSTAATDEMLGSSDNNLHFKASEDLGNGMTAFAQISLDTDDDTTKDEKVGLSGSFGTVVVGRMEDFSESKVLAMVDVFGSGGVELGGDNAGRQDSGMAYVSPSFNGLTIGVAGYALNDTANDIDNIDATDIALMYSNGPLKVNISQEKYVDDNGSDDEKILSVGVGYTMGDLGLNVVYQDLDNAGNTAANDHQDTMVTATYKMGNNTIKVGWNKDELTDGSTDNNTTALELSHSFSKRTTAYIGMTSDDYATSANETDTTYIGLQHSF